MYDYGVDVSAPIHHHLQKNTFWSHQYEKIMAGCYEKFSKNLCEANQLSRMEMNLEQPCTQHNYTGAIMFLKHLSINFLNFVVHI